MNNYNILLAGNPNVGKSSIFNILTGENQHTGNWIGKTVETKLGTYEFNNDIYNVYDLPGTYSLNSHSKEEEVTRNAILFNNYDLIVIVMDATSLKRNLNLLFQILEYTQNILLCINLVDEAENMGIKIDEIKLSEMLNINVVKTSARKKIGIDELKEKISSTVKDKKDMDKYKNNYNHNFLINYDKDLQDCLNIIEEDIENIDYKRYLSLKILENDKEILDKLIKIKNIKIPEYLINKGIILKKELEKNKTLDELIIEGYSKKEEEITKNVIKKNYDKTYKKRLMIDKLLTSKITGIPIMLLLVMLVFFITIYLANYPSDLLFNLFSYLETKIINIFDFFNIPDFIKLPFINGIYKTLTWVVSVMLPPMAIFFPMFSLLEDLGYLPRVVFNLDGIFAKVNSCGKQSITMMMGFGCNAVGVTNARIIDNPKQRIIAILTNNFVPCNGRFPMIISLITMFLASNSIISMTYLFLFIILSFIVTLIVSYILSKTLSKDDNTSFVLELPPFRKPNIIDTIIRSFKDKTLQVLKRAVIVSIPAGLLIYLFANINVSNISILNHINNFLDPLGNLMGLDGVILTAFLLGFPANEIVIPIIIMTLLNTGVMTDISDLDVLKNLFIENGWTYKTAILTIIFSIFHFPCSTTLLTIYKETKSKYLTLVSFILPTLIGIIFCILINSFIL